MKELRMLRDKLMQIDDRKREKPLTVYDVIRAINEIEEETRSFCQGNNNDKY